MSPLHLFSLICKSLTVYGVNSEDIPESCDEYMQKRIRRQKIKDFLMDCIPVVVVILFFLASCQ